MAYYPRVFYENGDGGGGSGASDAAAAIAAGGLAEDMATAINMARESIDSGKARQALDRLVEVSNA